LGCGCDLGRGTAKREEGEGRGIKFRCGGTVVEQRLPGSKALLRCVSVRVHEDAERKG
jgi:hypothetical protein